MDKINLAEKFGGVSEFWSPMIVGELNGQQVKVVKLLGEFCWHHHAEEDELFLVVSGSFRMDYREADGTERQIVANEGEFLIVPRGAEHRPVAERECHVMLFEPAGTLNTGNVRNERTVEEVPRG
jgi:mannose-6-phosphate isomerase-like protein (cupin superfamily)